MAFNMTVKWGDTLNQLAARHGTTVSAIAQANGITNPDLIIAGSNLVIPGSAGSRTTGGPGGSGYSGASGFDSGSSTGNSSASREWSAFNGTPVNGTPGQGALLNQMNFPGGWYKCGPTSVAMLADALGLAGGDAAGLMQRLSAQFGIDSMQQTPVDTVRQMLESLGINHQQFHGAGADALNALKAAGKGIINGNSGLGGHYMMVDGYDPATDTFTIKDPAGGVVKQMNSEQLRAWITNNDNGGFVFAVS